MKRASFVLFLTVLAMLFSSSDTVYAQTSGWELYQGWNRLNLTERVMNEGLDNWPRRVTWLPDGMGFLETGTNDAGGTVFYKVDPKNMKRSELFDKKDVEAMISEYNRITGTSETSLPFGGFSYIFGTDGIRFSVRGEGDFVFRFENRSMIKLPEAKPVIAGWVPHRSSRQLQAGTHSPDFTKIAYIKDYDIYVFDSKTGREERVTFGGNEGIMNGRTDWVYP